MKKRKIRRLCLTTTFTKLKEAEACTQGYKKLARKLGGVKKYGENTPINFLTILESNGLEDVAWCLDITVAPLKTIKYMLLDMTSLLIPEFEKKHPKDKRARKAIIEAESFLQGRTKSLENQISICSKVKYPMDAEYYMYKSIKVLLLMLRDNVLDMFRLLNFMLQAAKIAEQPHLQVLIEEVLRKYLGSI